MVLQGGQYYELGLNQLQRGELDGALASFERAIGLEPSRAAYRAAKGGALFGLGRYPEAERALRKALHLDKKDVEIRGNLALALEQQGKSEEALEQYGLALELAPDFEAARVNRGGLLMALGRYEEALANNSTLLELRPVWPLAHFNRGDTLLALGEWKEALKSFDQALELQSDYARAHFNRAVALSMLGDFSLADEAFEATRRLDESVYWQCLENIRLFSGHDRPLNEPSPQLIYLIGMHQRQEVCDWRGREGYVERFRRWLEDGESFMADQALAFRSLSLPIHPLRQADICRIISARLAKEAGLPLPSRPAGKKTKIRVGYVSPDFRFHPTARLSRQLYHYHDRERFEVYAYSLLPDDGSALHHDIRGACDRFLDVGGLGARELASRIRSDEVDILVDMAGHTRNNRLEVFALRPAPVQVAYLGFPNTTGANFIDYLVTDAVSSPAGSEGCYSENLVYLPRAYLVYDDEQVVATAPSRREVGLPENGTIFCCFNNPYKIEPEVFSCWLRILDRVPGSVLWLFRDKEGVERYLCREAELRGIDPRRLVFAPFIADPVRHLARYRLADLFLDTVVCNAHTTAADALWAGLPVLTSPGGSQWSRVATSLLVSVGMSELAVNGLEAYEEMAVRLGSRPAEMAALKLKLSKNRATWPLFDTEGYVRYLEQAYLTLWERHRAGLLPESFSVPA